MGRFVCLALAWTLACGPAAPAATTPEPVGAPVPAAEPSPETAPASAEADESAGEPLPQPKPISHDDQQLIAAFEDDLIAMDPDDPERPTTVFLHARLLWRYQHYNEAIELLEQVVGRDLHSEVGELAVNLLLDSLMRMQRFDELVALVNALLEKHEFLRDHEQLAARLYDIKRQSLRKDAERAESAGDYDECGAIYSTIYAADPSADRSDEVLYNAAYCYQRAGDLGRAIALRERLIAAYPKSRLAAKSLVLLANSYAQIANFRAAAERLEGYAKRYGGEKDAPHALSNAIYYRRALGDVDRLVKDIEFFVKQYGKKRRSKDDAAAALFSLAGVYRGEDDDKMSKTLLRYLKTVGASGGKDRQIIATVELGRLMWKASCSEDELGLCQRKRRKQYVKKAHEWFTKAMTLDRKFRGSRRTDLPEHRLASLSDSLGAARFYLADAELEAVLGNAKLPVEEVEQAYLEVVDASPGRWTVAALARRGQLFDARGDAKKAVEQYVACLSAASDANVDSEWSQLCDERVAEARPEAASPAERRPSPPAQTPVLSRPSVQQ